MKRSIRALHLTSALPILLLMAPAPAEAQFGLGAPSPQAASRYEALSCAQGRFVFGQISDSSKDQFMLDTFTGRLWRIGESSRIGIHLKPVPYCDGEGECRELPEPIATPAAQKPGP